MIIIYLHCKAGECQRLKRREYLLRLEKSRDNQKHARKLPMF